MPVFLKDVPNFPSGYARILKQHSVFTTDQFVSEAMIHERHKGFCRVLNIDSDELDGLLGMLMDHLPHADADMSPNMPGPGRFGLLLDRSVVAGSPMAAFRETPDLPGEASLVHLMGKVKDQGRRGTCVAFASDKVLATELGMENGLSEQFNYCMCKLRDGHPGPGTYIETALECQKDTGVCAEKHWEYNPNPCEGDEGQYDSEKFEEGRSWAFEHMVLEYTEYDPADLAGIKAELAEDHPILCGIATFPSMGSASTHHTGEVTMPCEGEPSMGGHSIALSGYRDDPSLPGGGRFSFANSWGEGWARNSPFARGYGSIPYAYLEKYGRSVYSVRAVPSIRAKVRRIIHAALAARQYAREAVFSLGFLVLAASAFMAGLASATVDLPPVRPRVEIVDRERDTKPFRSRERPGRRRLFAEMVQDEQNEGRNRDFAVVWEEVLLAVEEIFKR